MTSRSTPAKWPAATASARRAIATFFAERDVALLCCSSKLKAASEALAARASSSAGCEAEVSAKVATVDNNDEVVKDECAKPDAHYGEGYRHRESKRVERDSDEECNNVGTELFDERCFVWQSRAICVNAGDATCMNPCERVGSNMGTRCPAGSDREELVLLPLTAS